MTPSELKAKVEATNTDSYFFTRKTMKFFGDTMKNYGVKEAIINTYSEDNVEVWELYRKKPVKHGLISSAYFRKEDFSQAFAKREY